MWVFPKAIVVTTKSRIGTICSVYIKARLGSENNNLRENPYKRYKCYKAKIGPFLLSFVLIEVFKGLCSIELQYKLER